MTCDCSCYRSDGCELLQLPAFVRYATGQDREVVLIDKCIAPQIKSLWDAEIATCGCCCGHNRHPPSVVLHGDDDESALKARRLLVELDPLRTWDVLQWRLVGVTSLGDTYNYRDELRQGVNKEPSDG